MYSTRGARGTALGVDATANAPLPGGAGAPPGSRKAWSCGTAPAVCVVLVVMVVFAVHVRQQYERFSTPGWRLTFWYAT